ncbi:MAG: hypothetical protein D6770_02220, partial [Anaerolineae bacterium]
AVPAAPRASSPPPASSPTHTLAQALFGETSIKIALYLGAFFVIAAATILAALVEAARLPILLSATALFAVGAMTTRKRLSQPSFVLFAVFSAMLLPDARVLADLLDLRTPLLHAYWLLVSLSLALVWGLGTRGYRSRLFSLLALLALESAAIRLTAFLEAPMELSLALSAAVALGGALGAGALRRRGENRLAVPLLALTKALQAGILLTSFGLTAFRLLDGANAWDPLWWLAQALAWALVAAELILSAETFSFLPFAYLVPFVLAPIPWLALNVVDDPIGTLQLLVLSLWGAFFAAGDPLLPRLRWERVRKYAFPFLLGSGGVFAGAVLLALVHWAAQETILPLFLVLTWIAVVYAALHALRPRRPLWVVALLAALGAYFAFFALPFMEDRSFFTGYKLALAALLLLAPDLLPIRRAATAKAWRWPLRALGGFFTAVSVLYLLVVGGSHPGEAALLFGLYALFFLAYALLRWGPWLGGLFTAGLALALFYALQALAVPHRLPAFVALAFLYVAAGKLLARRLAGNWPEMLRLSGMVLGAVVVLGAPFGEERGAAVYVALLGLLFAWESFSRRQAWPEGAVHVSLALAYVLLLRDLHVRETALYPLGIGLILLALDWLFGILYRGTRLALWPSRLLGGTVVGVATLFLLFGTRLPQTPAWAFGLLTVFFVAYALYHRAPALGYIPGAYLPLTVLYTLRFFEIERWLLPIILLATLYYLAGAFLRRLPARNEWAVMLRNGGLILGALTALSAPFEKSGVFAALPVAVAATLFAAEAFTRRNVWLGFPANLLYLMGYFLLLARLNVEEPQFYSVGAAILGMVMHYLLVRSGSKTGAFLTGMFSQLALLGTTYVQLVSTERLLFFAVLFFQALVVLGYGVVIRSRSLVFTPILFAVLAVFTVLYGTLKGILTVVLIGCTGLLLIGLGILALLLRERLAELRDRMSDWIA